MSYLMPKEAAEFIRELERTGFTREAGSDDCVGTVTVQWRDSGGKERSTPHRVKITIPPAFPFRKPEVFPVGDESIENARHQAPGRAPQALCLYPDEGVGWGPWVRGSELVERVVDWFVHYHQDDWPPEDRPPDLHMYFRTGDDRTMMLYGTAWSPPAGHSSGRFSVWTRADNFVAYAGNAVRLNDPPSPRVADRALALAGIDSRQPPRVGVWFRLEREPAPRASLGEMLAEIDAAAGKQAGWSLGLLRGLVGNRVRPSNAAVPIALVYPAASGTSSQLLFLRVALPAARKHQKSWRKRLAEIPVGAYEAASVLPTDLIRRTGHTATAVEGKTVCVFGVGALGSSVALLLAKAGVPAIRIVDGQLLRPGNVIRHEAGMSAVGLPKPAAMLRVIKDHAPDCVVHMEWQSWDTAALSQWILDADVVVDATATPAFSLLLNELCVKLGRPAIYAAAFRQARAGRVTVVRPAVDACQTCYAAGYAHADTGYVEIPVGPEAGFVEEGCGAPTTLASAIDIEAIAVVAARTTLKALSNNLGRANDCIVVNEPLAGAEGILDQPGQHWGTYGPLQECATCASAE